MIRRQITFPELIYRPMPDVIDIRDIGVPKLRYLLDLVAT